jgi:hypothetical protein
VHDMLHVHAAWGHTDGWVVDVAVTFLQSDMVRSVFNCRSRIISWVKSIKSNLIMHDYIA